ncbi:MAG: hypothetical protein RJA36_1646 [Pseudomonadota bacterium]|jgi:hypothetical protein
MAIAHVRSSGSAVGANGGTTSGVDTTGANLIVLAVSRYKAGGAVTVSDSKSNTWTALTEAPVVSDGTVRLYYCYSPTVGAGHTFTASGTGIYTTIGAIAFSGAASSPFDQQSTNYASTSGTTIQPGSITPTEDGEVIVSATEFGSGATSSTIDSSFTETFDQAAGSGVNYTTTAAYLIQTTAAAVNPTITGSGATAYRSSVIASFKAAAGGASGPVGLAAETDAALPLSAVQRLAVGAAADTELALALAPGGLPVGLAVESDAAQALPARSIRPVGMALEAEASLALEPRQIYAVGLASETDAAIELPAVGGGVGRAAEADSALALPALQVRAAGLATDTGAAVALPAVSLRTAGLALEIDLGAPLAPVQAAQVGRAAESDMALALLVAGAASQAERVCLSSAITTRVWLSSPLALSVALASHITTGVTLASAIDMESGA